MPDGILIFGANGSGKSTIGRALAQKLDWKYMDIEDYVFLPAARPYTRQRSHEDCLRLMHADIQQCRGFVLSAVKGNWDAALVSQFRLAAYLWAPLELRLQRIAQRTFHQYGARVRPGGDMYEQQQSFVQFAANRSLAAIEQWGRTLPCPVLPLDTTIPIEETVERIAQHYAAMTLGQV